MTLIIWTAMIGLAAFRLWRLLAIDSITEPIHGRINALTTPAGQWLNQLWSCPWCLGFWISAALTWGTWWAITPYSIAEAILITFAASTITGLTARLDERTMT